MLFIYNTVVRLYGLIIKVASLKKEKAKQWVDGRKNWEKELENKTKNLLLKNCIWIHCASYGEFEQGKPLIEALSDKFKDLKIVVTFFSPSGYEAFKNWNGANAVFYLPLDTKRNARKFLEILQPKLCVFVKYEFWLNFLFEIKKQNIPNYLVSAVFKPHHPFFKWYGKQFVKSLHSFNKLFIQDEQSGKLLQGVNVTHFEITGDTRFDRVIELKNTAYSLDFIEAFKQSNLLLIAGSTWPKDEALLIDWFKQTNQKKLIIAPHQLEEDKLIGLESLLTSNKITYSRFTKNNNVDADVLIFDTMGDLSKLYRYADVTYVGGGFNEGLHNTLEPAVYKKAVLFYSENHNHKKYNEVVELENLNCAFLITSSQAIESKILDCIDKKLEIEKKLEKYFQSKSGSTDKIVNAISF